MYRTSLLLFALTTCALATCTSRQKFQSSDDLDFRAEPDAYDLVRAKRALSNSRTADYYELILVLVVLAVIIVAVTIIAWACCGCSCCRHVR